MIPPPPAPAPVGPPDLADVVGPRLLIDEVDRPTDRPTDPLVDMPYQHYLSARVTVEHSKWEDVQNAIHGYDYVVFPHFGSGKQHFHIFIPIELEEHRIHSDRIRKRFRDGLGLSGNGGFSIKSQSNGLWSGIQYGSKEGTTAYVSDDVMRMFVDVAPKWDPSLRGSKTGQRLLPLDKADRSEKDWQLTYTNLVPQAVQYARKAGFTGSLKEVVKEMIAKTKWRPSKYMLTGGVPEFYEKDYEMRTGKRKEPDMSWWTPRTI